MPLESSLLIGCAGGASYWVFSKGIYIVHRCSAFVHSVCELAHGVHKVKKTRSARAIDVNALGQAAASIGSEKRIRTFSISTSNAEVPQCPHSANSPNGEESQNGRHHTRQGGFAFANGDVYDGDWYDGKANGYGTYTTRVSKYVGDWNMAVKHGQAEETWADTSKYIGTYDNGKKHGKGRFEWPDGSIYEGEFHQNHMEGEGMFVWNDGGKYTGQFKKNRMHGDGKYEWPDGSIYEGQHVSDLKEGEGTFQWADGRRFTGKWRGGKQHGAGTFWTADKCERKGDWKDGIRIIWHDEMAFHTKPH